MNYKTLILNPEHGGTDPGAVAADGTTEALLNSKICHRIMGLTNFFIPTSLTRTWNDPEETELADRVKNATQYDIFITIAHNRVDNPEAKGLEIFHYPGSEKGILLAKLCYDNIMVYSRECAGFLRTGRGLKTQDLYVVNNAPGPSILIECGFLSNPMELYQLKQEKVQVTTAYAVAMAVLQFLGK